jgi:hypothetical protein
MLSDTKWKVGDFVSALATKIPCEMRIFGLMTRVDKRGCAIRWLADKDEPACHTEYEWLDLCHVDLKVESRAQA